MDSFKKYIAEFIGTFVLVFFGCGTAVVVGCDSVQGAGYLTTALAFGLVIVAMAYSIGNISGCHINPAVSLAMLISGKMKILDFVGYVIAQCLGSIAASAAMLAIFGNDCGFGANSTNNFGVVISLIAEVILTFVFVLAILGVTSKPEYSSVAGIVIGLALVLVHILGIGITGTSVNPARSIGPAIFAGGTALSSVWVFIVGPLAGGALAAVVYGLLDKKKADKKEEQ